MFRKLVYQTIVSEFDSHWVGHTSGLVPQLSLVNYYINELITQKRERCLHIYGH